MTNTPEVKCDYSERPQHTLRYVGDDGCNSLRELPVRLAKSLLWIDCTGGLAVGAVALASAHWLSTLYALPVSVVLVMGTANLAYGGFSFSLARRATRPRALLLVLAAANVAWAVLCAFAAAALSTQASPYGLAHLLLESLYVAGLGVFEWRNLDALLRAA